MNKRHLTKYKSGLVKFSGFPHNRTAKDIYCMCFFLLPQTSCEIIHCADLLNVTQESGPDFMVSSTNIWTVCVCCNCEIFLWWNVSNKSAKCHTLANFLCSWDYRSYFLGKKWLIAKDSLSFNLNLNKS